MTQEWEVGQWITAKTSSGLQIRAMVMSKRRDDKTTYTLCERPYEWQIMS